MTMCTCSTHCPASPYHERACCDRSRCDCWCHDRSRERPAVRDCSQAEHDARLAELTEWRRPWPGRGF